MAPLKRNISNQVSLSKEVKEIAHILAGIPCK